MRNKLILAALLLAGSPFALADCSNQTAYGEPHFADNAIRLCRPNDAYLTVYNPVCKIPFYSAERLVADNVFTGQASRSDDFQEDPSVPEQFRSRLQDFKKSGYDRGHMAPAADFQYDATAMSSSFLLSNMVPQQHNANAGVWSQIELFARKQARKRKEVYVMSGPLFSSPNVRVVGNNVCVPDATFKVIYDRNTNESIAFIVPNSTNASDKGPRDYVVSVAQLSQMTAINFSPSLVDKSSEQIPAPSFVSQLPKK